MRTAAIFDYGFGNVHSAQNAFQKVGYSCSITNDEKVCSDSDILVIPGVGSFDECIAGFKEKGGVEIVNQRLKMEKPVFGICVGFQILFDEGFEGKNVKGLGLLKGSVKKLEAEKLPHMGWNKAGEEEYYFVHSYCILPTKEFEEQITSLKGSFLTTEYQKQSFISSIRTPLISGTQFHPEKSGRVGLNLIDSLVEKC